MALPKNATLTTIWKGLRDPEDYLRGVYDNMLLCKRQHGSAFVKIGVQGAGLEPHYRVGPDESSFDAFEREILALGDPEDESAYLRTSIDGCELLSLQR